MSLAEHTIFRSLLQTPRPIKPLSTQLMGFSLQVQAISFADIADAFGTDQIDYHAIQQSVLIKGKPAFSTVEAVKRLSPTEFRKLRAEVLSTLEQISPMIHVSDPAKWNKILEAGARHSSNFIITQSLGSCFDVIALPTRIITKDRPEDYFGIPRKDLLDCHWMAYWCAKRVYQEQLFQDKTEEQVINEAKKESCQYQTTTAKI